MQIVDLSKDLFHMNEVKDMNTTLIDECFRKENKIYYEYDFGDGWSFTIEIKKIVDYDEDYPLLKRFKGDYNPVEDCGGVYGLELLLYYKDHPEEAPDVYSDRLEYLEKFDIEYTQEKLKEYKTVDDEFIDFF